MWGLTAAQGILSIFVASPYNKTNSRIPKWKGLFIVFRGRSGWIGKFSGIARREFVGCKGYAVYGLKVRERWRSSK